jgi:hypothetical protein
MTDTQVTDHIIKHLRQLDTSEVGNGERQLHASWHQVACSCGWTRKYVSQYRARIMHNRHAQG